MNRSAFRSLQLRVLCSYIEAGHIVHDTGTGSPFYKCVHRHSNASRTLHNEDHGLCESFKLCQHDNAISVSFEDTYRTHFERRICSNSVVLPAPRKPLSSVTGRRGSIDFLMGVCLTFSAVWPVDPSVRLLLLVLGLRVGDISNVIVQRAGERWNRTQESKAEASERKKKKENRPGRQRYR
jgi:hypothetical protein